MIVPLLLSFVAGALLVNAIPHLAAGVRGEPFPTPFASPPGRGLSSPVVNVLWGSANLFAGVAAMTGADRGTVGLVVGAAGFLLLGLYLGHHFGQVRSER